MTLKTICIKHVKFQIIKIKTSSQYIGNFYYCENLKWAAQNLRLSHMWPMGRRLDIAALVALPLEFYCIFGKIFVSINGNRF